MSNPWRVINAIKQVDVQLSQVAKAADNTTNQLMMRSNRIETQLAQAQQTVQRRLEQLQRQLSDCLSRENANCSSYINAIRENTQRLQRLKALEQQLRNERATLRRAASVKDRILQQNQKASSWLHQRQGALGLFALKSQGWRANGASRYVGISSIIASSKASASKELDSAYAGLTDKDGGHKSKYQSARQQFLRSVLTDPNQPRYIKGWIQQELNLVSNGRRQTLRNPVGMDVGHRFPNIDSIDNFRLEGASMNRARPSIARRLGIGYLG